MINSFSGEYRFLSNFYPSAKVFPTVEHHYQAAKIDPNSDYQYWSDKILSAQTPGHAKRIGQEVPLRKDWTPRIREQVMSFLVELKFTESELLEKLLSTGDQELVEGNRWHDQYFGDCCCNKKVVCRTPGKNVLGKILMRTRRIEQEKRGIIFPEKITSLESFFSDN
jgi:ribA/ribD-fused uncharacterized protein